MARSEKEKKELKKELKQIKRKETGKEEYVKRRKEYKEWCEKERRKHEEEEEIKIKNKDRTRSIEIYE